MRQTPTPVQQVQQSRVKHLITTEPRGITDTAQVTIERKDYFKKLFKKGKKDSDVSRSDSNLLHDAQ